MIDKGDNLRSIFHDFPKTSGIILCLGSGAENVRKQVDHWRKTPGESTSRAIFTAHWDSLLSEEKTFRSLDPTSDLKDYKRDYFSGGAPQLTGLYNIGSGITHGIVWKGKKYLNGIPGNFEPKGLQWRDRNFQLCDPKTRMLLEGAKKQVNEARIKKQK